MALFSSALALLLVLAWSGSALAGSLPATGSQGGFQQQYTHQYAKQFSQTSGDFQGYMKDFAGQHGSQQSQFGGYQQYLGRTGAGNATAPSAEASSTQGGSYQQYSKYLNQYVGDYAHFMGQAGAGNVTASSAEASSSQGGSYQQYMDKYVRQGGTQSSGYGGYVNFMGQVGAGNATAPSAETSSMQGGGYQQYMDKYMYQGGAQQFQSGKYQQPNLTNASDSKEWAAYYMNKYDAGKYQKYVKENSSNYTRRQAAASRSPASASSCHNVSELKAWRVAKLEQIKAYVPQAYRASAEDAIERTFHSNQARIEREQAIQAQHLADEEVSKAAREGSVAPASEKVHKVVKQGSAAPADHVHEPAPAIASGDGVEQEASIGNKRTDQGSADQAEARPPPLAANASSVQLASEGSAELVRQTHMDKSVASIPAVAVLVALFGAYVGKDRCRQRAMQPEGYVNLIAEP